MALVERIQFQHIANEAGSLVVAEGERSVPFAIQRVYYLFGVPTTQKRGGHAHKTLTQVAICVSGSCRFRLDDGRESEELLLARPAEGIVIRPMWWRDMYDFSKDCVLLVLASAHYDERDYIRSYDEFKHAAASR